MSFGGSEVDPYQLASLDDYSATGRPTPLRVATGK
jgi:hypothetical protein